MSIRVKVNLLNLETRKKKSRFISHLYVADPFWFAASRWQTLARKFSNIDFFYDFTIERWWVRDVRNAKKMERTCPEEHQNLRQSGFVSEEGHSGCKCQNIALELSREMFSAKYGLNGLRTGKLTVLKLFRDSRYCLEVQQRNQWRKCSNP